MALNPDLHFHVYIGDFMCYLTPRAIMCKILTVWSLIRLNTYVAIGMYTHFRHSIQIRYPCRSGVAMPSINCVGIVRFPKIPPGFARDIHPHSVVIIKIMFTLTFWNERSFGTATTVHPAFMLACARNAIVTRVFTICEGDGIMVEITDTVDVGKRGVSLEWEDGNGSCKQN